MKIFIDGFGLVAHAITRKLIEVHQIKQENLLVNTYDKLENAQYLQYLECMCVTTYKSKYTNQHLIDTIKRFEPDYVLSLYGRRILPKNILDLAKVSTLNLHPSLLPHYKGCFSGSWAIINMEKKTGITFHEMNDSVDTGKILRQVEVDICDSETALTLYYKLCSKFIAEFDEFFKEWVCGKIISKPMSDGGDYYPRKVPFGGVIDTNWTDEAIDAFVRGMWFPPHKGAVLSINNQLIECNSFSDYVKLRSCN